ncbi:MAG TPA: prolyl oligopeptidase family serine peptidase [Terracidiphilus sp.]|nr:prolyl oligopeptidase family serine peptidase [Terracidiphilus sp.]
MAIHAPLLSPSGTQALFAISDATADGAKSHLWLAPTAGSGQARQITFSPTADKRGEHSAQWAPDGKAIFFLARRGEHTQLFRLDLRGGDASPYDLKIPPPVDDSKAKDAIPPPGATKGEESKAADAASKSPATTEPLPIDVSGYAISQDGHWLALWAADPQTPGEKKQQDAKADAKWVDHETHLTRLYLAALKPDGSIDGALKSVAVQPNIAAAVWSPVTDRLLVFTDAPNNLSDLGPASAAWLVDASAPAAARKLIAAPSTVSAGAFSPGGSSVVFAAQTPEDAPPGYEELFSLALEASAVPRRLTGGFAGQLRGSGLQFAADGSLVTTADIGVRSAAVRIPLSGAPSVTALDLGSSAVNDLVTNSGHTGWLWLAQDSGHPVRLCYAAHLGDACTALPTPALAPAGLLTVKPQLIQWRSDGLTIQGLLYLPPQGAAGSQSAAKVPLIVDVHGGPLGAWQNQYDPYADFMLGHGWAILRPNPRGSSNYGVRFAAANKNDLGGGDYRDIMAGVDYALAHFPLDATRMALMGYSYGGEMAAFVEGKTTRFKAIVCAAPVIDQFSEYGTESGSWYDRWYFGKPWLNFNDAWRQSPLSGVAHAKTPFLLLQGESDTTDPLGQSQEMYRALRQQGVPVELVTYPRENHGPLARGIFGYPSPEPWHGFDARQRVVQFLARHLGSPQP